MDIKPTPFASDAPLGSRRAIIRCNPANIHEIEMIEASWGSNPRFSDGVSYRFVRAEGQNLSDSRCLVPVSQFHLRAGNELYRVTLANGDHFYLAGIWEPAMGDWPVSYRVITVPANPEVARYQERHGAIVHRQEVMRWLDPTVDPAELLKTPPARTFIVDHISGGAQQPALAL